MEKFKVIFQNGSGPCQESSEFNTREAAEAWAFENLPYTTLKCREGVWDVISTSEELCPGCGQPIVSHRVAHSSGTEDGIEPHSSLLCEVAK